MTAITQPDLSTDELGDLARRSVELIRRHQTASGAYPASPSFEVYGFSWLRDGAFIADAMSRASQHESAERFFGWCNDVIAARAGRIEQLVADRAEGKPIARDRMLPCRFTLDGGDDDSEWWNFQLDGYGTWLWALAAHARRTGGTVDAYADGIRLTVDYLKAFWNEPCFDWWEEHDHHRHVSTLSAISGGLAAIANAAHVEAGVAATARELGTIVRNVCLKEGVRDGAFTKWIGADTVDASLLACATPFRLVQPGAPVMRSTLAKIEERLVRNGVYRYEADTYYGGGQWLLLAGLLGLHYVATGNLDAAWEKLRWIAAQAREGELPEQVAQDLLAPGCEQEWIDRWGPSACPLLWSHAMYVSLAVELGVPIARVAP